MADKGEKGRLESADNDRRLGKNSFFVNFHFWEYRIGGKKCVNYNKFEIQKNQHKSNI